MINTTLLKTVSIMAFLGAAAQAQQFNEQQIEQLQETFSGFTLDLQRDVGTIAADSVNLTHGSIRFEIDERDERLGLLIPTDPTLAQNSEQLKAVIEQYFTNESNNLESWNSELLMLENATTDLDGDALSLIIIPDETREALLAAIQGLPDWQAIQLNLLPMGFESSDGTITAAIRMLENGGDVFYDLSARRRPNLEFENVEILGKIGIYPFANDGNCKPEYGLILNGDCFTSTIKIVSGNQSGSGVMIHPRYALTALHVVSTYEDNGDADKTNDTTLHDPDSIYLTNAEFINTHDTISVKRVREIRVNVGNNVFDLALLQLNTPFEQQGEFPVTNPILAATRSEEIKLTQFFGAGYGTGTSSFGTLTRRFGSLNYSECPEGCGPFQIALTATDYPGAGVISKPCEIDSGSPVYVETHGLNGQSKLAIAGILIGPLPGKKIDGGCATGARFIDLTADTVQEAIRDALDDIVGAGFSHGSIYLDRSPVPIISLTGSDK